MSHALKTKTKTAVFDALIAQNEIEAPAAMIDDEVNVLRQQAVQQFGGQAQIDPNTLPKELFEEQAIRRVKIGLLVQEVIKAGNLEATDERVDAILADIAESYDDADEVISYYKGNEQMLNQIRSLALEDEVVDHLLASAKVKEVKVSYEEALKPAQQ